MEKIIDTTALIDQVRILLWDRSKSREELAELVIGLIEGTGEEIVRCGGCKNAYDEDKCPLLFLLSCTESHEFCSCGERRDIE